MEDSRITHTIIQCNEVNFLLSRNNNLKKRCIIHEAFLYLASYEFNLVYVVYLVIIDTAMSMKK